MYFREIKNMGRMSKSEGWEGSEEGFASLREPHTGLAADSCCKTSSSAARFNERGDEGLGAATGVAA